MLYFLVHLVHVGAHLFTLNLRREGDLTAEMACEELQSKHLKGHLGPRARPCETPFLLGIPAKKKLRKKLTI